MNAYVGADDTTGVGAALVGVGARSLGAGVVGFGAGRVGAGMVEVGAGSVGIGVDRDAAGGAGAWPYGACGAMNCRHADYPPSLSYHPQSSSCSVAPSEEKCGALSTMYLI